MKAKMMTMLLLMAVCLMGCSSDDDSEKYSETIRTFLNSGCKKAKANAKTKADSDQEDSREMIQYKAQKSGYLRLNHINAMFECEATVSVSATISDGTIVIEETESGVGANCICRHDLTMDIGPLKTQKYNIIINRHGYMYTSFTVDYSSSLEGEFSPKS